MPVRPILPSMRILLPIDGSVPAGKALDYAVREHPDSEITALHVIDPAGPYHEGGRYVYEDVIESRRDAAEQLFDEARDTATARGVELTTETVIGDPGREIVAFAEEHGHDHIIIGSHGRTGATRVLLGSVAERVVRRAPVPVTVVR